MNYENNENYDVTNKVNKKYKRVRIFTFVFFMILLSPLPIALSIDRWVLSPEHSLFGPEKAIELKKEYKSAKARIKFKLERGN